MCDDYIYDWYKFFALFFYKFISIISSSGRSMKIWDFQSILVISIILYISTLRIYITYTIFSQWSHKFKENSSNSSYAILFWDRISNTMIPR